MGVRAKFVVDSILDLGKTKTVAMTPVVGGADNAENDRFWEYTPGGKLELSTINAAAADQFEVGKEYYLDFTPAD